MSSDYSIVMRHNAFLLIDEFLTAFFNRLICCAGVCPCDSDMFFLLVSL